MARPFIVQSVLFVVLSVMLSGCALFRFGGTPSADLVDPAIGEAERTAQLREMVDRSLREARLSDSPETAALVFRRPYYYREYVNYPDGIEDYDIKIVASDSRIAPYAAQVSLGKERYTTRFDQKKDRVRSTSNFYASHGYETRSYELRHGRWRELGTLFVAEETDDVLKNIAPQFNEIGGDVEDKPGFFRRLQFWRN